MTTRFSTDHDIGGAEREVFIAHERGHIHFHGYKQLTRALLFCNGCTMMFLATIVFLGSGTAVSAMLLLTMLSISVGLVACGFISVQKNVFDLNSQLSTITSKSWLAMPKHLRMECNWSFCRRRLHSIDLGEALLIWAWFVYLITLVLLYLFFDMRASFPGI